MNKNNIQMLEEFKNKSVVVTGHTGFKGTWLVAWLKLLGAEVTGLGLDPHTSPSHFEVSKMGNGIKDYRIDIRDSVDVSNIIEKIQPDFVFHMAAQPIVNYSYMYPHETWSTNVMGTINILEALRKIEKKCVAIMVTSDKSYENLEWIWGYRENDRLGGKDPYSASKSAAEFAINSYVKSFFSSKDNQIFISTVRAGNVIGGGDWSSDRIIPDIINSWAKDKEFLLRNPHSTRPWQHVLEPLGGYLILATQLTENKLFHGAAFNFGPKETKGRSVLDLVETMTKYLETVKWTTDLNLGGKNQEANLLRLNTDKASALLNWSSVLDFEETVRITAEWYKHYYEKDDSIASLTNNQIYEYMNLAKNKT
jgi:CDP-glucose 4,6-dehydratase